MKYRYDPFKIIHWDFNKEKLHVNNGLVFFEPELKTETFVHEILDDSKDCRLVVRTRFRIYSEETKEVVLSLICEEDFIVYYNNNTFTIEDLKKLLGDFTLNLEIKLQDLIRENGLNKIMLNRQLQIQENVIQETFENLKIQI